ncbi:MAG: apolipoprotein N-acyltransferase [Treponema sp.]|nr:apolipoprotein N-acyltransferase [Treponema sp.]
MSIANEIYTFGFPLLALFSLIPLYLALHHAKTYSRAFLISALQALITHMLSSYWLGNFYGFALFTLGASAAGTAGWHGLFGFLYFWMFSKLDSRKSSALAVRAGRLDFAIPCKILLFSSLYTIWEWCKSNGFLGYPWGTVSMAAYRWRLITQIADITGSYGVTFLFAFFSALFAEGLLLLEALPHAITPFRLQAAWKQTAKAFAALSVAALCYGTVEYVRPRKPLKMMNAILVQQNHDPWGIGDRQAITVSENLTDAGLAEFEADGKTPDVAVWSEGVLSRHFPAASAYYTTHPEDKPLISYIKEKRIPFVIGGTYTFNKKKHQNANAAILFDKNGKTAGFYAKLHLVPFAERIPGVEYEWVRNIILKLAGFSYGLTQGYKSVLFEIPLNQEALYDAEKTEIVSLTQPKPQKKTTALVSTPICFDDAFSTVCRKLFLAGSEVFINLTNDSWSQTNSAELQHFIVSSYRAIEFRTTLARATNSGYTTVVSPTGKPLQSLKLFESASLAAEIPIYERKMTVYARFGDWLPKTLAVLAFLLLVHTELKERESERPVATDRSRLLGIWFTVTADMSVWDF